VQNKQYNTIKYSLHDVISDVINYAAVTLVELAYMVK